MGLFTNGAAPQELSSQDHGKRMESQTIIWRPFRTVGMAAEQLRPSRVVIDSDPNGRYILKVNFYNSWTPEPTTHEGGSAGDGYVIFIGEEIPPDWTHLIVEKVGKKQTSAVASVPKPLSEEVYLQWARQSYDFMSANLNTRKEQMPASMEAWRKLAWPELPKNLKRYFAGRVSINHFEKAKFYSQIFSTSPITQLDTFLQG